MGGYVLSDHARSPESIFFTFIYPATRLTLLAHID